MPLTIATPSTLRNPGFMLAAVLGTPVPTNTVAGSVFTDEWDAAWVRIGATADGNEFGFSSTVEEIRVAEFKTPIAYETTSQSGSWSFSMAHYAAARLKMAYNGGVGALAPVSGTGATALYKVEPPAIGQEVRVMLGWESEDRTVRRIAYQTLQGGDSATAHRQAPELALIPVTFNLEVPSSGISVSTWFAGGRVPSADLFGQSFRLTDRPNKYALTRFMAMAARQGDVDEATASSTLMDFLQRCIHPDDWQRFDLACLDHDADWEADLLPIVGKVYEQATDRPTQRPSDSSDGPLSTEPKSTVVSSSPGTDPYATEIAKFETEGRRDLALFLVDARQQRTA